MSAERGERIDPKTRRPLPEGIRFRKDRGKYQVRVWAIGLNGEQRERSTYVETLAEAKKLRAETLIRRYPDGDMTLSQWHSRHWSVIEGSVRASTARAYERGWRLRVKPWLGHVKLEKLTAGVIEEAIAGWEGSTSTRIDALSVLSRLLDGAVRAPGAAEPSTSRASSEVRVDDESAISRTHGDRGADAACSDR